MAGRTTSTASATWMPAMATTSDCPKWPSRTLQDRPGHPRNPLHSVAWQKLALLQPTAMSSPLTSRLIGLVTCLKQDASGMVLPKGPDGRHEIPTSCR